MIGVAGYVNLSYTTKEDTLPTFGMAPQMEDASPQAKAVSAPVATAAADRLAQARLDREKSRSASMDVYRELIASKDATKEAKESAQANLTLSAKAMETETVLEQLIAAKGFAGAVVYLSETSANVVVKAKNLTPSQVAQIKDIIVQGSGKTSAQIKISEIE